MTGRSGEFGPKLLELGKRKSADHLTLCERTVFRTPGCLQKNGAAEKECKGEEGLRSEGLKVGAEPFRNLKQSEASLKSIPFSVGSQCRVWRRGVT